MFVIACVNKETRTITASNDIERLGDALVELVTQTAWAMTRESPYTQENETDIGPALEGKILYYRPGAVCKHQYADLFDEEWSVLFASIESKDSIHFLLEF